MGIKRDEFQRIEKNVLLGKGGEVFVLDFERGSFSSRPSNLPQLLQLFKRKGLLSAEEAIALGKRYIGGDRKGVFDEILAKLK